MILSPKKQIDDYTQRGWWGEKTLIDLFIENASRSADSLAVVDPPNRAALGLGEPQRLTYAQLKTATDRLAKVLLDSGIGKDDVVMVQLPNIVELVVVYLASARIGAILSPLPTQFRTHELRHVTVEIARGQALTKEFDAVHPGFDLDRQGKVNRERRTQTCERPLRHREKSSRTCRPRLVER